MNAIRTDVAVLRETLAKAIDSPAMKRLLLALTDTDGIAGATRSGRYGTPRSPMDPWFNRSEGYSIGGTIHDEPRSGQSVLPDEQQ